jgi:hypothetical protein
MNSNSREGDYRRSTINRNAHYAITEGPGSEETRNRAIAARSRFIETNVMVEVKGKVDPLLN